MKRALVLCSSTDGQTRRICERLRRMLEDAGATVTLTMIDDAQDVAPAGFDLAVVGARIRYGRTDARVIDFARRHAATLEAMPSAYFSVNIVARKPARIGPQQPLCRRLSASGPVASARVEVFAGRLDYPRYGIFDRLVIRLIMRMTGGPRDPIRLSNTPTGSGSRPSDARCAPISPSGSGLGFSRSRGAAGLRA